MQNELHVLVSVDLTVPALMDVQSMRRGELSMRLQLLLLATAYEAPALTAGDRVGGAGSRERKGNLVLVEGDACLQVLPAEQEDDVQV